MYIVYIIWEPANIYTHNHYSLPEYKQKPTLFLQREEGKKEKERGGGRREGERGEEEGKVKEGEEEGKVREGRKNGFRTQIDYTRYTSNSGLDRLRFSKIC